MKAKPIEQRFWPKVDKQGPDDCWLWTAAKRGNSYGAFGITSAKVIDAHRVSFAISQGIDPTQLGRETHVCHSCDNPLCVNPGHLFAGTHQDNMDDKREKDRGRYPFKTHCQRNHELAVTGVYSFNGSRRCRQCHIDRSTAWKRKKKMERASHGL